jgi:hypothetical protein
MTERFEESEAETAGSDGGDQSFESAANEGERAPDIPEDAVEEAERLTRLARNASDPDAADAYRDHRSELADEHGYTPRVREDDDTLVLYPSEWMADGTVQLDRIEETERAVERPLSGAGDPDRYEGVTEENATILDRFEAEYGVDHAENARAYATFLENHHVRSLEEATIDDREEFLEEYYPRNAWPNEDQRAIVDRSLELLEEHLEKRNE